MCGRYTQTRGTPEVRRHFEATCAVEDFPPRYNIAPQQNALVVVKNGQRILQPMRWGLVPFWAKDEVIGTSLINARAETLAVKPAFRNALKSQRCLVPADGFYEWIKQGRTLKPVRFVLKSGGLFAFAGLWDRWQGFGGIQLETFTILTTEANPLIRKVHDRMPVIVPPDEYESWLADSFQLVDLDRFRRPWPAEMMDSYPVSPEVNRTGPDTPACIKPYQDSQQELAF